MPRGPKGEKRDADVIKNAVRIMKIATGQRDDPQSAAPKRAEGGKRGGKQRAATLSPTERQRIAKKAARARWGNTKE